jgi:hypothetical protein
MINSVIKIGDVIECEIYGIKEIVEVKDIKVIYNHPVIRPTKLIIWLVLKDRYGSTEWEFTSNNIKIIRNTNELLEKKGNKI